MTPHAFICVPGRARMVPQPLPHPLYSAARGRSSTTPSGDGLAPAARSGGKAASTRWIL
ncbi:hypothetical protein CHLRE_07g327976v5 [Chlamydomonas reinhardtii]|uniref:Uncharacterized protein n=1 Tax=Chlamydomonas reinhardtii TaxID=3055 RepID=A0A2K3DJP4_CHLRE|nr:uncharacterized protein CHLRE_07g327976v5 [Chlamydomonas reinhardtii]PNW80743.1 hypothetical protein CHLRE_07g327976v5 [Chlamydomonas reinhardtii]